MPATERTVAIGFRVVLVTCAALGLWWVVADPAGPAPPPPKGAAPESVAEPQERGPQVLIESAPVLRKRPERRLTEAVTDPRHAEARRREPGLRPVLDNLQGEPVYVEGVDGPTRKPR